MERQHRHIIETGLSLLTHASMPLSFWTHAFATAVYLINRLPTPTLNNSSPFTTLFRTEPKYSKLRAFGCLCYLWLRPYPRHKLDPKSTPCVFIDYSPTQSAYYCFDPSLNKNYVSRHVKFIEHSFPFAQSHGTTPTMDIDTWCSISLPIKLIPTDHHNHTPTSRASQVDNPPNTSNATPLTPLHSDSHLSTTSDSPYLNSTSTQNDSAISDSFSPPPTPTHSMTTKLQNNIRKPIQKLNLHPQLQDTITEPINITQALKSPVWRKAMEEEFQALIKNKTWDLVPSSPSQTIIGCKWVYRIKRNPDGSIKQYKARLVAKGFHQRPDIDYKDIFSPVVKPATIQLILSIALKNGWSLRQLDINNAFLQGTLSDEVYMSQPPGFQDVNSSQLVCKLHKAFYGLKQTPRAWYHELRHFLITYGFKNSICDYDFNNSICDSSLFIYQSNGTTIYLIVYVDDIIITCNSDSSLSQFVNIISKRFSLKDLGELSYFLGVEVVPQPNGLFLSERKYIWTYSIEQKSKMLILLPQLCKLTPSHKKWYHPAKSY